MENKPSTREKAKGKRYKFMMKSKDSAMVELFNIGYWDALESVTRGLWNAEGTEIHVTVLKDKDEK
jgi:hypothetical protein